MAPIIEATALELRRSENPVGPSFPDESIVLLDIRSHLPDEPRFLHDGCWQIIMVLTYASI
jgi:hypothetical protein